MQVPDDYVITCNNLTHVFCTGNIYYELLHVRAHNIYRERGMIDLIKFEEE